jgi:hypothetical protein
VLTQVVGLELQKIVDGAAEEFAPATFTVQLECTIAGAPLVMGAFSEVDVPANGTVTVDGLPLGSECEVVDEPRSGGAHAIDLGDPVSLHSLDTTARITIQNTFNGGPLVILKERAGQGADRFGSGPFLIQVTCTWMPDGVTESIQLDDDGVFALAAANGYRVEVPMLPVGTWCEIVETDTGGATSTAMNPADGRIQIVEPAFLVPPATVTITNHFNWIPVTGLDRGLVLIWLSAGLLLLLGGGAIAIARSRHGRTREG